MKKLSYCLAGACLALSMASAHAQFAKPDDAVKYRKSAFTLMKYTFAPLSAMASGKAPLDAKEAAERAATLEALAKLPWTAFPEGSTGAGSKARPEVWTQRDKFNSHAEKFQAAVAQLNVVAKSGDANKLKAAVRAVGDECKACHQSFED